MKFLLYLGLKNKYDMKKLKLLPVLFIILSAISFTSCDTEPIDPVLGDNLGQQPNQPGDPVFKVDFSGQTYIATSTLATVGNGLISIGGFKGSNGEMLSIIVQGTNEGTYDASKIMLTYSPNNTTEYGYTNSNLSTGEDSGTVVITEIDTQNKTISGTFSFTGWWSDSEQNLPSVAFSNGVFTDIPYTGGVATGEEFFKANVDGTANSYAGADLAVAVTDGNPSYVSINAYGENHRLILSFPTTITAGTYQIESGATAVVTARFRDADDVQYGVSEGTFTVTSNQNGWIKGTFTFPVKNTAGETIHNVTAGDFNVEWDF